MAGEAKSFNNPDEVRTPPKAKVDVVELGGKTFMKMTFQPGWKWSECIKPTAGTDLCMVHHLGYVESGRIHTVFDDGVELDNGPGDIMDIPAGHDAWVVGDEPVVMIDVAGATDYAKGA